VERALARVLARVLELGAYLPPKARSVLNLFAFAVALYAECKLAGRKVFGDLVLLSHGYGSPSPVRLNTLARRLFHPLRYS